MPPGADHTDRVDRRVVARTGALGPSLTGKAPHIQGVIGGQGTRSAAEVAVRGRHLCGVRRRLLLGVNLEAGAGTGTDRREFLASRADRLHLALMAGTVLCLADWVLVDELGFLGVGTTPDSMVPVVMLSCGRSSRHHSSTADRGTDDRVSLPTPGLRSGRSYPERGGGDPRGRRGSLRPACRRIASTW